MPLKERVTHRHEIRHMNTRRTIDNQKEEGQPGWQRYGELFGHEDAVYLELDGAQADVTLIWHSAWN
ncbi:hypothetical protein [Paraburkholderia sp. BR14320]|uniref:hypothetical protein n=1 Tax=unclassified Paraburkholderia TaxID=2615204 RepID=UPI0034CFF859